MRGVRSHHGAHRGVRVVNGTVVDFPAGVVHGTGTVVDVVPVGEKVGVITDRTPFHPVDPSWPDQPADSGTLDGLTVVDCLVGAVDPDGGVAVDTAITARRGDEGYQWVVVHVVDGPSPTVGSIVDLQVDAPRRSALSRAHTGCHVSALALNAVVADLWRRGGPARRDRQSRLRPDRSDVVAHDPRRGAGHVPPGQVAAQEGLRLSRAPGTSGGTAGPGGGEGGAMGRC